MTSPLFGQATQMLGASLGSGGQNGGLNPLCQIGGPRSAELALTLILTPRELRNSLSPNSQPGQVQDRRRSGHWTGLGR